MDTTTTQEELEEVLLDESISYPRCFASLEGVHKDIQDSLLSHYLQYNITRIASGCYKYYEGPEFEFGGSGLGKKGWYRVVSDKKLWDHVWRSKKSSESSFTMVSERLSPTKPSGSSPPLPGRLMESSGKGI